jgi:hypothetical protein
MPSVVEVPVQAGVRTDEIDGGFGEFEVALRQRLLLATAPAAQQRIYFSRLQTDADSVTAYARLADDAVAGREHAPITATPATSTATTIPVTVVAPAGVTYSSWQICTSVTGLTCATERYADLSTLPTNVTIPAGPTRLVRTVVVGRTTATDGTVRPHAGIAYTTYDATPPVVTGSAAFTPATGTCATFSWRYADAGAAAASGIDKYVVQVTKLAPRLRT